MLWVLTNILLFQIQTTADWLGGNHVRMRHIVIDKTFWDFGISE